MAEPLLGGTANLFLGIIQSVITIGVIAVVAGLVVAGVVMVYRLFSYNTSCEFWQIKGNQAVYMGDDSGKKVTKKGVAYIKFLKRKGNPYDDNTYPPNEAVYKKGLFGSKIKFLLVNEELVPSVVTTSKTSKELSLAGLTNTQKISYIQKMDRLNDTYKKQGDGLQKTALVLSFAGIGLVAFGLFIIWQSNEATAQATQALANAISAATAAPTLPEGA